MKTNTKIMLVFLCLSMFPALYAQVTIGVAEAPVAGALLQLKDIAAAAQGGKNATKGLLMPRVNLVSDTELKPMIEDATLGQKEEHTGLVVYNLTNNGFLKKGIMVWNGQEWNHLKNKEETTVDVGIKKDLYQAQIPNSSSTVFLDSLEISMTTGVYGTAYEYYATPRVRRNPSVSAQKMYSYQVAQYWHDGGYSNDVVKVNLGNNNTTALPFMSGDMSTMERNEVWMIDDNTNTIYHIHFFVLGPAQKDPDKIYAILGERF
ncbi:MAG: hypothetical protein LBS88_04525 [Tannerellaceae bacterium]|jgi:hypothetical protein|nr:hypothetical protein [Tannerellaceae bacterium]